MRILILLATLFLAACTSTASPSSRAVAIPPPAAVAVQSSGSLLGATTASLLTRLGTPVLQVREGNGLMLQYRTAACVLDIYVYPQASGAEAVTHVDARDAYGRDVDREACTAEVQRQNG